MHNSAQKQTAAVLRPERVLIAVVLLFFAAMSVFAIAVVAGMWKSPEVRQLADELRD